jgi:predicted NBD/HSP70 family sugar kinase
LHLIDVKQNNKRNILKILYSPGIWSKRRIADKLKLSPSVITRLCSELSKENIIQSHEAIHSEKAGRREVEIDINKNFKKCIGVSLDDKFAKIILTDLKFNIMKSTKIVVTDDAAASLTLVINSIKQLIKDFHLDSNDILGIGISIKGNTDGETSYNGVWSTEQNVTNILKAAFSWPIFLDNGVRCSAIYEQLKNTENNFVIIKYVAEGIGSALVLNGELQYGQNHNIADFGHTIIDPQLDYCPICKRAGCLESIVSIEKIILFTQEHFNQTELPILWKIAEGSKSNITLATILKALDYGEILLNERLAKFASFFATAFINTKALYDVDNFVIISNLFNSKKYTNYFESAINHNQLTPLTGSIEFRTDESNTINQLSAVALLIYRQLIYQYI